MRLVINRCAQYVTALFFSVFLTFAVTTPSSAAVNLSGYNVNINDTSVSGLSSGAYMAVQMQVAYSSIMKGAGIIAGGPYNCGAQMLYSQCMFRAQPSVSTSISRVNSWSGNQIDNKSNLANHKVYMFSGTSDETVHKNVMDQLYKFYVTDSSFIPSGNVNYYNTLNTAHTFPTDFDSTGNNGCTTTANPWISNCSFDAAGAILQHIYGTLNARNNGTLGGLFVEFNQSEFISSPRTYGMDDTGWAYVPSSCSSGSACKLHVAFHGCKQMYEVFDSDIGVGDKFVKNTGYARWADTNNIIVLFPQTVQDNTTHSTPANYSLPNPNGCWDWVGWYGADFDQKSGKQLFAIKKMIDRVSSGYSGGGSPAAPTNVAVGTITDTSIALSWTASSGPNLAGYNVYRNGTKVNGSLVTTTTYTDSSLTAGTTYTYYVKAQNTSSVESVASNTVTATTTGGGGGGGGGTVTTATFNSVSGDDGYVKANSDGSSSEVGSFSTPAMGRGVDSKFSRSVLSFDTSSIPDTATVTRAYLTVTYSSSSGDPWSNPSGNTLVVDIKTGTFGAATMETGDWAASPTASAVANIVKFTAGTQQSTDFDSAGLAAVNKTGKTQLKLRFSSDQTSTNYIFITEGTGAVLTVVYQEGQSSGPAAPTDLLVTGVSDSTVSLSWTASSGPNLSGYNVYRGGTKVNGSTVTATSYTDTGLSASTAYSYYVKAVDTSAVESFASNTVTGTTTGTGSSTTVTFPSISTDDGYVKANSDGSSPAVGTYSTPAVGRGVDSKFSRTILSFDTSALPDSATITQAYVTVTYSSSSGDPWSNPSNNTLVIDVKNGTFGAATTETSDWAASATSTSVATIASFTSGSKQSSNFSAGGLSAINKTGKTQLKLRFSSDQTSTNYIFLQEGAGAVLTVVYQ